MANGLHVLDHLLVRYRHGRAAALAQSSQDQEVSNRARHAQAVGDGVCALPRAGGFGAIVEGANNRRASLGLHRHHLRALPGGEPANGFHLGEGLPHADEPRATASGIDDPVGQGPVELFGELVAHRLFALGAARLAEGRDLVPPARLGGLGGHAPGIGDQPVDQRDVGAIQAALVDERLLGVLRDEDFALHARCRGVGRRGVAGISGGRQEDGIRVKRLGSRNRGRQAARLE